MIYNNSVYMNKENNDEKIRIIEVDALNDICFYYSLNSNTPNCDKYKLSDLECELSNGFYIKIPDLFIKVVDEKSIPLKDIRKRDFYWDIVQKAWLKYKYDIIEISNRKNVFKIIAEECSLSERTIRRLFSKFFKYGMIKTAFIPNYSNCGGKGKDRELKENKVGRPKKYEVEGLDDIGINIKEDIKIIFKDCVKKYYSNEKQNSLMEVYDMIVRDFFSYKYIENGVIKYKHYEKRPTYFQFYYWFKKYQNPTNDIISRLGKKEYELNYRPILSNSTIETIGPGTRFQVDATVADLYVVSNYDRERIIGRPIIYAIIDVFSRLVTGIYVGLEGPSWAGAMMALDNMVINKVEFCKKHGIEIEEDQWPAHHLPQILLADRGEFEGYSVENLISNLGIVIENTPPYRGDLKGIVERSFRTVNEKVKHKAPGAIMKEYRKRGDGDYRSNATLTLEEFNEMYIKIVIKHNNSVIEKYPMEKEMLDDGIAAIPTDLWRWGLINKKGNLRVVDRDIMRLNIMPKAKASVSRSGIKFKGLYYSSQKAIEEQWFVKNKEKTIKIIYDPRNLNCIYIPDDDGRSYDKCYLLDESIQYKDFIIEEVVFYQELKQESIKERQNGISQKNTNLEKEIEDLIKKTIKEKKDNISLKDQNNTKKIKGIKNNRSIEKEINRENEKFELGLQEKTENQLSELNKMEDANDKTSYLDTLYEKIIQEGNEIFE